jgi:hypothetical protein
MVTVVHLGSAEIDRNLEDGRWFERAHAKRFVGMTDMLYRR